MIKKLVVLSLLLMPGVVRANVITDQIQVALLGHVETVTEVTTRGRTNIELLATPIQIGQMGGDYLLGVDGGVLGDVKPQPGQGGFQWTAGIHFHLTPILKKYILTNINSAYTALNAIEINPRASLTFEDNHTVATYGLAMGFAFQLNPIQ